MNFVEEIASEFLEAKKILDKAGFEVVGTQSSTKEETFFVVKKKTHYYLAKIIKKKKRSY